MKQHHVFSFLQRMGKSFMLPIAVLPVAGIFLGVGSSLTTIQHRESIGQYKAGRPQSESANRHGNSTNTVRENLRDNDPHHCSQSHGITGNSHHNNNQQHNSCDMKIISGSHKGINYCQSK